MSDLIERLHDLAKSCGYDYGTETGNTAWEAASELDRLRSELAKAEREWNMEKATHKREEDRIKVALNKERQLRKAAERERDHWSGETKRLVNEMYRHGARAEALAPIHTPPPEAAAVPENEGG